MGINSQSKFNKIHIYLYTYIHLYTYIVPLRLYDCSLFTYIPIYLYIYIQSVSKKLFDV